MIGQQPTPLEAPSFNDAYLSFLRSKTVSASEFGFPVDPGEVSPLLKPHQAAIVRWMVAGGRRACFAAFGLGKTVIQLEAVRLTRERAGGRALIVIPLGVRQEFFRDAAMLGVPATFIRRIEEATDPHGIYLTNYETVRDGRPDHGPQCPARPVPDPSGGGQRADHARGRQDPPGEGGLHHSGRPGERGRRHRLLLRVGAGHPEVLLGLPRGGAAA